MLGHCPTCTRWFRKGKQPGNGAYCSSECARTFATANFCDDCIRSSLPVGTGQLSTFNGFGFGLFGKWHYCAKCGSIERMLCFCVLWLPVFNIEPYRVKYLGNGTWISRRVGKPTNADAQAMLDQAAYREGSPEAAIKSYEEIVKRFPNSSASREAEQNIDLMRRKEAKEKQ